jgi:hypothetical protein
MEKRTIKNLVVELNELLASNRNSDERVHLLDKLTKAEIVKLNLKSINELLLIYPDIDEVEFRKILRSKPVLFRSVMKMEKEIPNLLEELKTHGYLYVCNLYERALNKKELDKEIAKYNKMSNKFAKRVDKLFNKVDEDYIDDLNNNSL